MEEFPPLQDAQFAVRPMIIRLLCVHIEGPCSLLKQGKNARTKQARNTCVTATLLVFLPHLQTNQNGHMYYMDIYA